MSDTETLRYKLETRIQAQSYRVIQPATVNGMRGLLVRQLDEVFPDERRIVIEGLFSKSKGSTKNLSGVQISVLLDWLGYIEVADNEGRSFQPRTYVASSRTEEARIEGLAVIREAQVTLDKSNEKV